MNIRKQTLILTIAGLLATGAASAEHSRWGYPPEIDTDNKATRIDPRPVDQSGSAVAVEPRWGYPPVIDTIHTARPILTTESDSASSDAQIVLTYEPRWGYPPLVDTPHKPIRAKDAGTLGAAQAANRE